MLEYTWVGSMQTSMQVGNPNTYNPLHLCTYRNGLGYMLLLHSHKHCIENKWCTRLVMASLINWVMRVGISSANLSVYF